MSMQRLYSTMSMWAATTVARMMAAAMAGAVLSFISSYDPMMINLFSFKVRMCDFPCF